MGTPKRRLVGTPHTRTLVTSVLVATPTRRIVGTPKRREETLGEETSACTLQSVVGQETLGERRH